MHMYPQAVSILIPKWILIGVNHVGVNHEWWLRWCFNIKHTRHAV